MTLAVYPLVYLPVAASLRNADPAQEEVARSLGLGRYQTFWRVTVGQARLAILGGSVLVALVVLAEFGAFEILGFNTLTTEVYTEFLVGFNQPAACAFSLILVLLGALLLFGESAARGRGRTARIGCRGGPAVTAPAARAHHAAGAGRAGLSGRPGPGRARGRNHPPAHPGRRLDLPDGLAPRRHRLHLRLFGLGRVWWPRWPHCPSRCSRCVTPGDRSACSSGPT